MIEVEGGDSSGKSEADETPQERNWAKLLLPIPLRRSSEAMQEHRSFSDEEACRSPAEIVQLQRKSPGALYMTENYSENKSMEPYNK